MFQYDQAFSRNNGLLTPEEQAKLRAATVAIPGMGGVGGFHLLTLARLGIGGFKIADFDTFSIANFNRQCGAFVSTIGKSKTEVMTRLLRDINPEVRLEVFSEGVQPENADDFLKGTQVVIDGFDAFNVKSRRLLFSKARNSHIPVVTAGPIGFSCAMLTFLPNSPSFDNWCGLEDGMNTQEMFIRFVLGVAPRPYYLSYMNTRKVSHENQAGPSVGSAVTLCAGFAATEVIKLLTGRGKLYPVPHYHYFDPFLMKMKIGCMPGGNAHFLQRLKLAFIKRKHPELFEAKSKSV